MRLGDIELYRDKHIHLPVYDDADSGPETISKSIQLVAVISPEPSEQYFFQSITDLFAHPDGNKRRWEGKSHEKVKWLIALNCYFGGADNGHGLWNKLWQ